MNLNQINIIIPLYNEEGVFEKLVKRLKAVMDASNLIISVILVDDGSTDATAILMENISLKDERFSSVFLSRNFGHQTALTAGLSKVDATEAVMIIDGDLQDPPELLEKFYEQYKNGFDVVYAVREKRKEGILKRLAYKYFYRILKKVSNIYIPIDSGDFSLISRKVVDDLNNMKEESRFLRGMRSWVGYKQIGLKYERHEREEGISKYSIFSLYKLALNGIFNFSELPIRIITILGASATLISIIYLTYTLVKMFFFAVVPEGFTGIMFTITLFGGVQLLSVGVLGEYIIRIFFQVKERPLFIIDKTIKKKKEDTGEIL